MTDTDYQSLVLEVPSNITSNYSGFMPYLNIASLAHRFCMTSIETWALGQFKRVMCSSALHISHWYWHNDELLGALLYVKLTSDRELEHHVRNMIQCYIQHRVSSPVLSEDEWKAVRLVEFYQLPLLKQQDPALFGHIFCVVLSVVGHKTSLWKRFDRDTRYKLLAAHVYLTPLPSTLPTSWIHNTSEISAAIEVPARPGCFNECSRRFNDALSKTFNSTYCSELKRDSPLSGVTALCKLATHRQSLSEEFRHTKCQCANKMLSVIDLKMDALFSEIAEKYHDCLD
jgi:hypothetical protein